VRSIDALAMTFMMRPTTSASPVHRNRHHSISPEGREADARFSPDAAMELRSGRGQLKTLNTTPRITEAAEDHRSC
jgi:hypothetical protein